MNKKLFLAGVALLAAVGFTSCNSETPIDPSTPSGIAPAAVGHQVGVDYDWAVKANSVAQFEEYWAADKDAVQKLVKDKKTASICIIADEFTLENKKIEIPQLWADATGKIINVRIAGGFKNPDFMRADWLKNGMAAKKWAVKISTSLNKGAEVNFTIDSGEFDLDLESEYTRTTIDGAYTIGYLIVKAAKGKVRLSDRDELPTPNTGDSLWLPPRVLDIDCITAGRIRPSWQPDHPDRIWPESRGWECRFPCSSP